MFASLVYCQNSERTSLSFVPKCDNLVYVGCNVCNSPCLLTFPDRLLITPSTPQAPMVCLQLFFCLKLAPLVSVISQNLDVSN
jgi:hypothetical protein